MEFDSAGSKTKYIYREAMDKKAIWDDTIAIIRLFQAEFVKCVKAAFIEATLITRETLCMK